MSFRRFVTLMVILFVILFLGYQLRTEAAPQTEQAAQFDHSQCQYPYRVSNPENGCDNSEPACVELIKGAAECPETEVIEVEKQEEIQPVEYVSDPNVMSASRK